jgi:hypothetical protein
MAFNDAFKAHGKCDQDSRSSDQCMVSVFPWQHHTYAEWHTLSIYNDFVDNAV